MVLHRGITPRRIRGGLGDIGRRVRPFTHTMTLTEDVQRTARYANSHGISVIPIRNDGSKAPLVSSWAEYAKRLPAASELRAWFQDGTPEGLAFICGQVSGGLTCIDIDAVGIYPDLTQRMSAAGLNDLLTRIEEGYLSRTPNGYHWLYRCADQLSSTKLARDGAKTLIEVKGERGYVIEPPSAGGVHESGKSYTHISGSSRSIVTITPEEQRDLLAVCRSFDVEERKAAKDWESRTPNVPETDRPGDRFNATAGRDFWHAILPRHGWAFVYSKGDEDFWRRPGKQQGISASTNYKDSNMLYVFSTSVTEFEIEQGYSPWRVKALLDHDGDFSAAARAIAAEDTHTIDLIPPRGGEDLTVEEGPTGAEAGIDSPTPRSVTTQYESVFPSGHLVRRYMDHVGSMNDASQAYHEALALSLIGASMPGVRAHLTGHPKLAANLYMVLVGRTSRSRKTSNLRLLRDLSPDPSAMIANRFSPEALIEAMSYRSGKATVWIADEFGPKFKHIKEQTYMTGTESVLLELYDGEDYRADRHSKRVKGQAHAEQDYDLITDPHLSIVAASTPALYRVLSREDIESGLVPRFIFILEQGERPRQGMQEISASQEAAQDQLKRDFAHILSWATARPRTVRFTSDALTTLDQYDQVGEESARDVLARLGTTAYKLAMISAIGTIVPEPYVDILAVENVDAERAVALCHIYAENAREVERNILFDNPMERTLYERSEQVIEYLQDHEGRALRSVMQLDLRIHPDVMDKIRTSLQQTNQARVGHDPSYEGGDAPPEEWMLA